MLEHYKFGLAQTTTLKYLHYSEKTMQSNKATIIITTAILILTLLTAGCTDTGGANPETPKYTLPPEEVAVVEETTAAEPFPEPVETPWYAHMRNAEVGTYSTMFGEDIYAVKGSAYGVGNYNLFDTQTEGLHILRHQEFTPSNLRLDLELSPDQYRTLIDQYGSMISVTMETIDLDQDGAMDKVAVKYVGTDGVLEFTDNYKQGWTAADFMSENIDL